MTDRDLAMLEARVERAVTFRGFEPCIVGRHVLDFQGDVRTLIAEVRRLRAVEEAFNAPQWVPSDQ